jgi:hypothetical protein
VTQSHITRYDLMPIPPVDSQTEYFEAGAITFGVEYRLLTAAIAAIAVVEQADGSDAAPPELDDRGVSIHVFAEQQGERRELLRFDCFEEDPHYHYVCWDPRSNEMLHLDPVADGDPLAWALDRLRTRLSPMLVRAGAAEVASRVDERSLDEVLPRVAEAAYRARYNHDDDDGVLERALAR